MMMMALLQRSSMTNPPNYSYRIIGISSDAKGGCVVNSDGNYEVIRSVAAYVPEPVLHLIDRVQWSLSVECSRDGRVRSMMSMIVI